MRRRLLAIWPVLLVLLLGGCAGVGALKKPAAHPLVKPPASAADARAIAGELAKRGRWSDAIALLDQAAQTFPDAPGLAEERLALQAGMLQQERLLEDQIMVGDAENLKHRIDLLEKLSLAQPDNLIVMSRRIYWREVFAGKIEPLTACGEVHAEANPPLAWRCFHLASRISSTPDVEQRLQRVSEQLRQSESLAAERRRAAEEKERHERAKVLLGNARLAIEERDYRRALDILDTVDQLQPNDREVLGLQEEALSMLSPQVEALIKLGDHLYLDEQLDAAVATWQAALSLKPDDEEILARIERARTVLNRLDALRRQQNALPVKD